MMKTTINNNNKNPPRVIKQYNVNRMIIDKSWDD